MIFIYNLFLHIALVLLSPIVVPILLWSPRHRANLWERLGVIGRRATAALANLSQRPILIHAVSVGEVGVALKIIQQLKRLGLPIVLSTITTTGQAFARQRLPTDIITLYLPFDLPVLMRRFLRRINPRSAIIVETELWPNFINEASKCGIPVALVNGRISDRSFGRYRRTRPFWRRILPKLTAILAQSEQDKKRFVRIGAGESSVQVAGTVKFDISPQEHTTPDRRGLARSFGLDGSRTVIVAGSTHPGEEAVLLRTFASLKQEHPDVAMIIAPRHVERGPNVAQLAADNGLSYVLRSEQAASPPADFDVLILDTIGELAQAYQTAAVAFVGKSLSDKFHGGHNPIEPAACGVPTIFGPNMQNFRHIAATLVSSGAAIQVANSEQLLTAIPEILKSPQTREQIARAATNVIKANRGATERTVAMLERDGFFGKDTSQ
nr:3-deoxy-D-manno-octulosonic acid transferase [Bacillota bacterium]